MKVSRFIYPELERNQIRPNKNQVVLFPPTLHMGKLRFREAKRLFCKFFRAAELGFEP